VIQRRESRPIRELLADEFTWLFSQSSGAANSEYPYRIDISGSGTKALRRLDARCRFITGTKTEEALVEDDDGDSMHFEEVQVDRAGIELKLRAEGNQGILQLVSGSEHDPNEVTLEIWTDNPLANSVSSPLHIPTRTITPYSHRLERQQLIRLSAATTEQWKRESIALLNAIDPNITDLDIVAPDGIRARMTVRHKDLGLVPLSSFGEGIRRIVMFALAVPSVKGGVLLIDEIETAIHVSALSKVFTWLVSACKTYKVQLFATTHSLEAVDALLGSPDIGASEVVTFKLGNSDHENRVRRLSGDVVRRLREERGLDVR
jgi:hypothetical protein